MADGLLAAGYEKVEPEAAEVLLINTCAFIDPAKQEAIDTILAAARAREAGESPADQKIVAWSVLLLLNHKNEQEQVKRRRIFLASEVRFIK